VHALVPPVAEQLGVEREAGQPRLAPLRPVGIEARDRLCHEVAGVPARPIKRVEDYAFAKQEEWIDTADLSKTEVVNEVLARFAETAERVP